MPSLAWVSLILGIGLGLPNFSYANEWQQAGLRHADFARALGSEGTRFSPEFLKWAADFIDGDCQVTAAANKLQAGELRRVELIRTQYCWPWNEAWRVCDADQSPSWCADPATVAKEFEKYFDTLVTAVKGTRDALQRYNLMAVVVAATGVHAITQFPVDRVDRWVAKSAVEFLRTATPAETIQIVRLLQITWFGVGSLTARHLKAYAASRVMSEEERRLINDAGSRRHAN